MNSMNEIGKEYGRLMEGEGTGKTKAAVRGVEMHVPNPFG